MFQIKRPSRGTFRRSLILAAILLTLGRITAAAQPGGHWLTGYYAFYNDNVMSPTQVDYTKLTHIIFWPVLPNPDGTLNETEFRTQAQFDADANALVAAAHAAGVKALLGIGGDQSSGASAGFSGATTAANLPGFVSLIVSTMQKYNFDGVDINWEEISATNTADNAQFTAFIAALRAQLNTINPTPLLTMAPAVTSFQAGTETTQQLIASVASDFDQLNIQTYVMSRPYCGWETWYNAPLSNGGLDFLIEPTEALPSANGLIASYATAGIPMSKMAIGIQFDAAVWQGGTGTSTGGVTKPHQTWTNDAANCGTNLAAPNWTTTPYRVMISTMTAAAGYTVEPMDTAADQNWLSYDPSGTGTTNEAKDQFVSYDSPQSIAKKGTDLASQAATTGALGGAFIFELSGDYAATAPAAQQHPLLDAAYAMASLLPGSVTGLTATPAATSATLNWSAAPGAATYNVYFEASQGSGPSTLATNVAVTQATIPNLTPGQQYWFLVEAVDAFGTGTTSEISATIPGGSNVPANFTATADLDYVTLSWSAVPGATSYTLYRSTSSSGPFASRGATAKTSYADSAVTAGVTYYYYVTATGSFGVSTPSSQASATPFGPIGTPTGLAATVAPGAVMLTWNAVAGATSYEIERSTVSGGPYAARLDSTTLSATDHDNFNGTTTWYYVVYAYHNGFHGSVSNQVSVKPPVPIPGRVGTPVATAGMDKVTLTWTAVSGATSYDILRSTVSGGPYTQVGAPTASPFTDTTAIGGYTYYYVVVAANSSGSAPNSPQASATPTLPAPTALTATVAGLVVNLSWTAVNGATGYEVLRGTVSGSYTVTVGETTTATTLQDQSAKPGIAYYYVVMAYNNPNPGQATDFSAFSNQVTAKVTAIIPAAPTNLQAYLAQAGGGVNLTWTGVAGAATYNILRSTTSGGPYTLAGSALFTMYTDAPLAAGTYYYVVQAVNSAGVSPNSNQASYTVPKQSIPIAPDIYVGVTGGQVNVDTLGSYGATTYGYYRANAAAGPYSLLFQGDTTVYTDSTVVAGKTYYYEMTAGNLSGTSPFTAPVAATIPFAPTGLKAAAGNAQVALTWTAVAGASSYTVIAGTSIADLEIVAYPTTNSFTYTGLTNGTPYYFEVQTTGADGQSTSAFTAAVSATPAAGQQTVTWIPDWDGQLLQVRVGSGAGATAITINLPSCNPNSVAVNQNQAYVVCNANGANPDKILVYNATTIRAAKAGTLTISPLKTITSADFSSLIGIAFDASNNLWVASNGNNDILEFTAAQLATATPKDVVSLSNSPGSPVALAFDTDGSLWATGLYGDGILLNLTPDQFGLGGNANPRYCAATDNLGAPCISQANLFLEPEGVAVFNGSVWVANNSTTGSNGLGGATPGRELVNLTDAGGTLSVAGIYGSVVPDTGGTATSPFFCPGGLYATSTHLWVNDESYGEATPQCGANGDSASKTGGVFSFTPAQLTAKPATLAPAFTGVTGRPGFGGIFVEFDQ